MQKNYHIERLSRLRRIVKEEALDSVLISAAPTIAYLTGYHGFSVVERDGYLLATQNKAYLFTSGLYRDAVQDIAGIAVIETTIKSPFLENLKTILKKDRIKTAGYEANFLSVAEYHRLSPLFEKMANLPLRTLREIKSSDEINTIQHACSLGLAALVETLPHAQPGISEQKLAGTLEIAIKQMGANLSFPTIIAFGKNSAVPHHLTGETKLGKQDVVVLDFGVLYKGYCSDISRTIFVGTPTKVQQKAYNAVLEAQTRAVSFIRQQLKLKRPVSAKETDKIARDYILSQGFPSIPHSLGHGIGIEVHESPTLSPVSRDLLTNGMVFSIEPGIYLAGKFGIRIEDLFAIEKNKLRQLTHSPLYSSKNK